MLILHLSDLHFGPHSRFAREDPVELGKGFARDLVAERKRLGIEAGVDLVVVSGDVAESGLPAQLDLGRRFLTAVAGGLGVEHRHFVFVPGNHDVCWPLCRNQENDQQVEGFDEEELRRRIDEVKLRP